MFLIEKNVPLPPKSTRGSSGAAPRSKYPFLTMEVGDSFLWKGAKQRDVSSCAGNACKAAKDGRKFATRTDKAAGGIRCWRVA